MTLLNHGIKDNYTKVWNNGYTKTILQQELLNHKNTIE